VRSISLREYKTLFDCCSRKKPATNKENKKRKKEENTIMKRKEIIMVDHRCQIMTRSKDGVR
jgi:hypothetical protein